MSIRFKTLAELKRLLRNKEISSYELVNETFKNISSSKTNSFITLDEEAALNKAKDFDEGKVDGDLAGIPIAQKDLFCTKNLRTTCGSKILENFIPPYDATVVDNLSAAGSICVGKTNMDEFAMGSSNETSYYGTVRNPWDFERVPGGSSGGSAAAFRRSCLRCNWNRYRWIYKATSCIMWNYWYKAYLRKSFKVGNDSFCFQS